MGLLNNDKVQVTYRGTCFGQEIILTQGFTVVGDFPVITTVSQDLDSINTDLVVGVLNTTLPNYLACLPGQYTNTAIRSQKVNAVRSAYREIGTGGIGTNANNATVANDSACLTLRGAFAGRAFISNKHIGPVPDASSAAGLLTLAYRLLVSALGVSMIQQWTPTGSGSLLVPSVWANPAANSLFLTAVKVGLQSRVQRRRTVGIGA